ncbi:DNA polymerase III subunit beta [Gehongia tenuis]|uniref:Beta sliding clamp n=1 Tax=Gehongia tenuis TaxID=2763655 RepID=A0A926D659_9FIRM|nr:DNA polymerase III subunit beta [Gehongia tenuis]MBC8532062.1 DNA polymerase III subunit beta [Gehongia tenuis]
MRLRMDREDLSGGISTVTRALATRTTLPILEGILLETTPAGLRLVCNDTVLSIEDTVPVEVMEEGSVVVPGRMFSEIVRRLPEGKVELELDGDRVIVRSKGSKITVVALDAAEYPRLPAVEDASPIKIPQKLLKEKINQVIFATADDETRPILTGVLMEMGRDMTLVALDGYRLAMNHLPLSMDGNRRSVVPGKSLSEMARTLSDGDELVEISFQGNHIRLDMGPIQMISRLLEGEFIQYRQILPTDFSTLVKLSREAFFDAIQRASLVVREGRNNLIRLHFEGEELAITANSEMGDALEKVAIECEGKPLDIAFNAKYLSDVLKSLDDEFIQLNFSTSVSPLVVTPVEGEEYLYLVLPVRLHG